MSIPIDSIVPDHAQHRRHFDEASLEELADSIRSVGLLQPVVVVRHGDLYKIVAGERRWRACKMIGLSHIGCEIKDLSPIEIATVQATENIARQDIRPCEEGMAYQRIYDAYRRDNPEVGDVKSINAWIAQATGSSWNRVDAKRTLLELPSDVRDMVDNREIGEGIGYTLVRIMRHVPQPPKPASVSQSTRLVDVPPDDYAARSAKVVEIARAARARGWSYQDVAFKVSQYLGELAQTSMDLGDTRRDPAASAASRRIDVIVNLLAKAAGLATDLRNSRLTDRLTDTQRDIAADKVAAAVKQLSALETGLRNRGAVRT